MTTKHRKNPRPIPSLLSVALASCLAITAPAVLAQSTSATLRGVVTADAAPTADAVITATNVATGLTRSVQSAANGGYSLAGLPPGSYRIDVNAGGKTSSRTVTLAVGQTATLDMGVGGAPATTTLGTVTVVGAALLETRTSEVASYVSQKQIEALPQSSRNFLAFADTVPGVVFSTSSEDGSASLRSGAQLSNGINVFIDGVGQKDYVLKGGVTGQDTSRGNPFPQLGIAEYKVITSNYKAEFDQLSSAAIVAVTRSGTNDFHGDVFGDYTSNSWTAKTINEENGAKQPKTKNEQFGVSLGGPIMKDRMHFFAAYEGKKFDTPVSITPGRQFTGAQLPTDLQPLAQATSSAPFDEDLFFGKIDWIPDDNSLVELSAKYRKEDGLTNIGDVRTAPWATLKSGKETRVDLRYQYSATDWLNDAHITFEDATFGPRPATLDNGYSLRIPEQGREADNNPGMNVILEAGGGPDQQSKGQRGYAFQDDFSYFAIEGHTIKAGIKFKSVDFSALQQQPFNPQFRYDILRSLTVPYEVEFTYSPTGTPEAVKSSNKQFGIYLQDDWQVSDRLLLNLGVRWDYEKTPSYEDHVTPAALVAALQADPNINDPNVDYDYRNYISTGSNRSAFKGAIQPRFGFSYDIGGDQRHVVFGGAGRSYNRNQFDYLSYENYSLAFLRRTFQFNTPGHTCTPSLNCLNFDPALLDRTALYALASQSPGFGEVFLLNNDLKTPYSDQFSLGIRNAFTVYGTTWNSSATVVRVLSHDGITFSPGNRRPGGVFWPPGTSFGNTPPRNLAGYGRFFVGNNAVETRLTSLLLSLDKPYSKDSAWGVTLAYTYSDAEENRNNSDIIANDWPNIDDVAFTPALGVSKHRFVGTGIADWWGITFSGKLTMASPAALSALNCHDNGFNNCFWDPLFVSKKYAFKQLDLAMQKEWALGGDFKLRVRGDVLNVMNWRNFTGFADWRGGPNEVTNFGQRTNDNISLPTRTFKLTAGLSW